MSFKNVIVRAYNKVKDDITYGKFKQGDRLSERFLTEKYGVSRTSGREIIRQLVSEGFLTYKPNRGVIVARLSLNDIDVIYKILIRCESYATAMFTERQNKITCERLKLLNEKMHSTDVKLQYKVWQKMNDKFHHMIYLNCGNGILSSFINQTRLRVYRFRRIRTSVEYIGLYNRQHTELLTAILNGNSKLSEKLMIDHLETARMHRLEVYKELEQIF